MIRGARVLTATALTLILAVQCSPPAFAVTPPPIDSTLLPPPAPPAPPEPTVRRQPCTAPLKSPGRRPAARPGVDLAAVWRLSRGAGQRVAVIDTGVQPYRRLPAVVPGGDYVSGGDGTQDCDGHGTIVAGVIAAAPDPDDPDSPGGIAPEATLISIRQSSMNFGPAADPAGRGFGDVSTLAMAVRTAADMGASVINISSVACSEAAPDDRPLGAALAYAVDVKDAVVVSAAGNVGGPGQCPAQNTSPQPTVVVSPAWYDDYVLTVASVDADGAPSAFSLRGPWVDVAAPGENVVSPDPAGSGVVDAMPGPAGPAPLSGTSYSAPVVSALAALVRSRFPRLSARQVIARIENTARHAAADWDPAVGHGVVDVLAALSDQTSAPSVPVRKPVAPEELSGQAPTDADRPRGMATAGAGVCLAVLLALGASFRSRRRRGPRAADVPGD